MREIPTCVKYPHGAASIADARPSPLKPYPQKVLDLSIIRRRCPATGELRARRSAASVIQREYPKVRHSDCKPLELSQEWLFTAERNLRHPAKETVMEPTHSASFAEDETADVDVALLIADAIAGDKRAWQLLHRRYAPLVAGTAARFRLHNSDVEDVSQMVWLKLVRGLKDIRQPDALPGWIITTTRREALRVLRTNRLSLPVDPLVDPRLLLVGAFAPDENLQGTDRWRKLQSMIGDLKPVHRELIRLLFTDPQVSYSEISRRLGIPIGSIGPTRARCLRRLRSGFATPTRAFAA